MIHSQYSQLLKFACSYFRFSESVGLHDNVFLVLIDTYVCMNVVCDVWQIPFDTVSGTTKQLYVLFI
jgi:hypothetical protein